MRNMAWRPAAAGARPTTLFGTPEHRFLLLSAMWPHVVGPAVAQNSVPLAVNRDVLTVRVADARWRRALHRMHRDIIVRLRERAGALAPARLGFIEGGMPAVTAAAPAVRPAPPAPPPDEVVRAAETIADPELRAAFLRTAGQYLENRRNGRRRALRNEGVEDA
jgi:hypothetical protein